jgi:sugar phosphate isomerase/epimerase
MTRQIDRRDFLKLSVAALAFAASGGTVTAADAASKGPSWPLYAFDNGLGSVKALADKCKLLRDLGYVGLEYHMDHKQLPLMLEQLDKHGLKMNAIYSVPLIEDPADPKLPDSIKLLKGRDTRIEMAMRSKTLKPSDPAGDDKGVDLVKKVSDLCGDSGPVVSIYPHMGMWTECVEDGVRMAKLSGRKNVGTNFNLVHWAWNPKKRDLETTLREALANLFLVTFNGLKGAANTRQAIRPLDESDYDLMAFLATVAKVGYDGAIGLQCFSIKEPAEEHLKRSMQTWKETLKKLG